MGWGRGALACACVAAAVLLLCGGQINMAYIKVKARLAIASHFCARPRRSPMRGWTLFGMSWQLVDISLSPCHQVPYTIGDPLYLYVFTKKAHQVRLTAQFC